LSAVALVAAGVAVAVIPRTDVLASWDGTASALRRHPMGPVLGIFAVALAAFGFVPVTLLTTTSVAVFGMTVGAGVVWVGATLGALMSYELGRRLRRTREPTSALSATVVRRLEPLRPRWIALEQRIQRNGLWAIIGVRLVPFGNFGAFNLFAGWAGVPWRAFLFGNLLGLLPGILGLGVVVQRGLAALRQPTRANVSIVVGAAMLIAILAIVLGRLAKSRR